MSISIALDNPIGEYRAGTVVSGSVFVQLGESKSVKKVAIDFDGDANTSWSSNHEEHRDGKSETVSVHYSGSRKLLQHRLTLVGGPGNFELPPGRHQYRFEYQLPSQLPANFEGDHGHIRYTIKAYVDVPWGLDLNCIQNIKVTPNVDLNTLAIARQNFHLEKEKTIGILCCSSGTITFTVTAPKSGYVCCEIVPFEVHIENNSNAEVYETEIQIKKNIDYTVSTPSFEHRNDSTVLISGKWATVAGPNGGQFTLNAPLEILPTEPTIVDDSAIIKIGYVVEVTCKIRGMHTNKTGRFPIYVGTVPINIPGEPPVPYTPIVTPAMITPAMPPTMAAMPPTMYGMPPTMSAMPPTMSAMPPTMSAMPPTMSGMPPTMPGMSPTMPGMPPTMPGMPPTQATAPPMIYPPMNYPPPTAPQQGEPVGWNAPSFNS